MEMGMEMDLEWSGVMFHWDNEHRKEMEGVVGMFQSGNEHMKEMEWVVGIYH